MGLNPIFFKNLPLQETYYLYTKNHRGKYFAESWRFSAGLVSLEWEISVEFIKFRKYPCEKGCTMLIQDLKQYSSNFKVNILMYQIR